MSSTPGNADRQGHLGDATGGLPPRGGGTRAKPMGWEGVVRLDRIDESTVNVESD